jgi:hypothetical protein
MSRIICLIIAISVIRLITIQEEIDLVEKLFFDSYRLGEISNNITLAEPIFRDADVVSLDLNSIKSSDSGNFISFVMVLTEKKYVLSRYAGISDKVSIFGIFNHNNSSQESVLIAQIIWYFIEGFHRSNEYPFGSRENYIKYIVPMEEETLFHKKSDKTDRWWIEIPFISNGNNKLKEIRYYLVLTTNIWEHVIRTSREMVESTTKNSI